ncbi:MAG: hypothetical protein H0X45_12710 [Planctomycetes bacterium]|nr:hypothetical protein [Planctomycetota bacterium]
MSLFRKLMLSITAVGTLGVVAVAADHADSGKEAAKPYPFDTCIVSGEAFGGEMGEPHVLVHDGREVKLCCKGCVKQFTKKADSYAAILDEGIKAKAAGTTPVNPAAKVEAGKDAHDDGHKGHDHGKADDHQGHDHGK